ncbi:lipopolysaccharide biosynthesis protein [Shewanella frigidimarina]|uniref:lipopolysaccharide biosynthesis protein n=1 Tax=Shewanella frigidimarina TaxID=56812 RepID=UPI003D796A20
MQLKSSTVGFVYLGKIYSAILAVLLIPQVIKHIGYEAYGLVGIFVVLQACLNILDAGISGVLTRQSITSRVDHVSYSDFVNVFNKIVKVFIFVGLLTVLLGGIFSFNYSVTWLNSNLNDDVVIYCTAAMFFIFAIRYVQGPYRSILLSNEQHKLITAINVIYVTLSQPVALLFIIYINDSVLTYFLVQIGAALITSIIMVVSGECTKNNILSSLNNSPSHIHESLNVKSIIFFGLQLSTLSILWIAVNQSDKLTLTASMQLEEYTFYSVAFSVTALLTILSEPVNQILLPRLTKLYHEKMYEDFKLLFERSICIISSVSLSLAAFMFFNGESLLFVWGGDLSLANKVNIYLPWIFIGSTFAVLSNFSFLLRYSFGELRIHTFVYALFAVIVIPLNVYLGWEYKGEGVALFFAANSFLLFIFWSGYNFYHYFENGIRLIFLVVLPILIISMSYFYCINYVELAFENRFWQFVLLLLKGIGCVGVTYLFVLKIRPLLNLKLKNVQDLSL